MCSTCTPVARSAAEAPDTAALIARAPCEPPVTISTGPSGRKLNRCRAASRSAGRAVTPGRGPALRLAPAGRMRSACPGDDCVHYQCFQRFANFLGPAQLYDGKIKIGVRVRLVFQCVMPPLAIE